MLTSDLLRYNIDEKTISPRYLTRKHAEFYLKLSRKLLDIYHLHIGKTRKELEQALDAFEQNQVSYKIVRGLVKIIDGCTEYAPAEDIDYSAVRKRFFEYVENFRPVVHRPDLIHKNTGDFVIKKFIAEIGPLPQHLYGDLPENKKLIRFVRSFTPEELIRRYNLALAQGLLYRCYRMHVRVWDSYKTVFHYIKLARLMHAIRREEDHYYIMINGPFSLFRKTQKYGINLAMFLPGLMLAQRWVMQADVNTDQGRRIFTLDHNCGLTGYYKKDSPFDSAVEEAFYKAFRKQKTLWEIQREGEIIDLGDTVLIPDFTFEHPDGRSALLEIVGFWTPEYLHKKLDKLARANRRDLIVAVNEKLNCSKNDFRGPVIFYKTRVKAVDVLKILDDPVPV
ncbi:MAG: DUF790 family protein [Calditrichaeota bacterium]|nr:DUF790 family protein [Calditrichota bacterium]